MFTKIHTGVGKSMDIKDDCQDTGVDYNED